MKGNLASTPRIWGRRCGGVDVEIHKPMETAHLEWKWEVDIFVGAT